jgi:hypothetical protein
MHCTHYCILKIYGIELIKYKGVNGSLYLNDASKTK